MDGPNTSPGGFVDGDAPLDPAPASAARRREPRGGYVRRGVWRLLVPKGRVPGVRSDGDRLLHERPSAGFLRHRGRLVRQNQAERRLADEMGPHGLQVFDREAGRGELGGYLARGRE